MYREHADFVWRTAHHMGAAPQDLGDIVHDVFLIAHRRREDFEEGRPLRNWLFGITRNVVARAKTVERRQQTRLRPVPNPPPIQPSDVVERSEAVELLREFLGSLPETQRDVFFLHEVEGMSAPDIVDTLGVKLNTVYSRLRLARGRFNRFAARQAATLRRRHD